jgi:hypothetical protein
MPWTLQGTNLDRSRLRYRDSNNRAQLTQDLVGAGLLAKAVCQ